MEIKIKLNNSYKTFQVKEDDTVLDLLRRIGIKSVKDGCNNEGACGSCAILLEGKLVNSCLLKAPQIDGKEITTVEGLSKGRLLHPIQKAFIDAGVVQCGYCTPSQILAVKELLDNNNSPAQADIKDALSGSLCRCTGYKQLYTVVDNLTKQMHSKKETFRSDLNTIGKPAPKIDAVQFVKADTAFVEDKVSPHALIIKVMRSPHAHARIIDIDTTEAEKLTFY